MDVLLQLKLLLLPVRYLEKRHCDILKYATIHTVQYYNILKHATIAYYMSLSLEICNFLPVRQSTAKLQLPTVQMCCWTDLYLTHFLKYMSLVSVKMLFTKKEFTAVIAKGKVILWHPLPLHNRYAQPTPQPP
jgi:hypothetical protein